MDSGTRPVSGSNGAGKPSSDELLRQLRLTRTRLDAKTDALQARLQPLALIRDVQDAAFRTAARTERTLRYDPRKILIPAAVIVAGMGGWLAWRARKKQRQNGLYLTAGATMVTPPPPKPTLISALTTVATVARQVERAAKAVNTLRGNGAPKAYPTAY
jgi:hypothetical protein